MRVLDIFFDLVKNVIGTQGSVIILILILIVLA